MNLLEIYLRHLSDIRSSGASVGEIDCRSALENLFDEVGKTLQPKVRCTIDRNLKGAGVPDGGFFSASQFRKVSDKAPLDLQNCDRGVIEIRETGEDIWHIIQSDRISRDWQQYGLVLVANYRDFILIEWDASSQPVLVERYRLAQNEADFWSVSAGAIALSEGDRFLDYLKRVMRHAAAIATPADLAWFLASCAREAKSRISRLNIPLLAAVQKAFEETLAVKFDGETGDRFFRSTFVQTLFYGIFSAWVLWHRENPTRSDKFNWKATPQYLQMPVIRAIFSYLDAEPPSGAELELTEVLERAASALNRCDRAAFFSKFDGTQAVQYFYEPFLQAFDPQLRKDLGVWYTPPEIVKYMVARVDAVLREDLQIENGLANPHVCIIDPCCGTGAYLVEVLKSIAAAGGDVKQAAIARVFGCEILTAPLVVAHLQLGLLLQSLGLPFFGEKERLNIYLGNALTNWKPPVSSPSILVILGNPPYNAFAGIRSKAEQKLAESYKQGLNTEWGIRKFNLGDLYIRFFRLAEQWLAENNGKGVACYLSNFSYLSEPSFAVMRKQLLEKFKHLWFDCLNGDSRETGKMTPEGKPDPSVFSTKYHLQGIRVGTAIALMACQPDSPAQSIVRFRHFWGAKKRADLLASLHVADFNAQYRIANPNKSNRYSFRPSEAASHYLKWPKLTELCAVSPITGYKENRGYSLIDGDRAALAERMQKYFDSSVSWDELKASGGGLTRDAARFDAEKARKKALNLEAYDERQLMRYALRPYEVKWCYYTAVRPLWNEPRPSLFIHHFPGNAFLVSRPNSVASPEGVPFYFIASLGDFDLMRGHSYHFPFRLGKNAAPSANLSPAARAYLDRLGIANPDANAETAGLIWWHALAVGYSPAYCREHADGLCHDWPHIPLPNSLELLVSSAELGRQVAALLDIESAVSGATSGEIRPELQAIALFSPADTELKITVGWGYAGKGGVTMPGKGKIFKRSYTPEECAAVETMQQLGETTCDIYLNDIACWKNIPVKVWEYTIGGYQVIKKWLSYREGKILGRSLFPEEVSAVTDIARRIAAIVLLEPALDANYQRAKQSSYNWQSPED